MQMKEVTFVFFVFTTRDFEFGLCQKMALVEDVTIPQSSAHSGQNNPYFFFASTHSHLSSSSNQSIPLSNRIPSGVMKLNKKSLFFLLADNLTPLKTKENGKKKSRIWDRFFQKREGRNLLRNSMPFCPV